MGRSICRLVSSLVLAVAATASHATINVYTSQAAFMAAVVYSSTDTFDDLDPSQFIVGALPRTAGAFGYSATALLAGAADNLFVVPDSVGPSGVWLSTDALASTVMLSSFTGGVQGIGANLFPVNFAGDVVPGTVNVTATFAGGFVTRTLVSPTTSSFIGFLSDGGLLLSMAISPIQGSGVTAWPAMDNVVLGSLTSPPAVDESGTTPLMVSGLVTLFAVARVRRRHSYRPD